MITQSVVPPAGDVITAEGVLAFGNSWAVLAPSLTRFARLMTHNKQDRNDLLQDTMVELWNLDPTRYDFNEPADVGYLRRCLILRMWAVWGDTRDFSAVQLEAMLTGLTDNVRPA